MKIVVIILWLYYFEPDSYRVHYSLFIIRYLKTHFKNFAKKYTNVIFKALTDILMKFLNHIGITGFLFKWK